MDVKEIVIKHLKDNGFDGLYSPGECACRISDMMPCCSESCLECEPGYFQEHDREDYEFMIGPVPFETEILIETKETP